MVRVNGKWSAPGRRVLLVGTCFYLTVIVLASAPAPAPGKKVVSRELYLDADASSGSASERPNKDSRVLFSPRMDYDEWTPLGRGDPLKNDPTYVYVPPVLEHVHYWVDPSSRTPDPPLPGAMTLGQSSLERNTRPHEVPILRTTRKKPTLAPAPAPVPAAASASTATSQTAMDRDFLRSEPTAEARRDPFDPFLKFLDVPKFSSTLQQHFHQYRPSNHPSNHPSVHPQHPQRSQYMPQTPYYPTTYTSKQRPNFEIQQSYSPEMFSTDLYRPREPYTMLVPPPLQGPPTFRAIESENSTAEPIPTATSATPPTVETVKVSPVYQASALPDWIEGKTQLATLAAVNNQITRKPSPSPTPPPTSPPTPPTTPTPTTSVKPTLLALLSSTTATLETQKETMINAPSMKTTTEVNEASGLGGMGPLLASLLKDEWTSTSSTVPPTLSVATSTVSSLTTDALFSHYKQPASPLRGPMYLIIQGHSKVKTYGAGNPQRHKQNQAQETDDINQIHDEIDRSGRDVDYDEEYDEGTSADKTGIEESATFRSEASNCDGNAECVRENEEKLSLKRNKRQLELIDDLLPVEEAAFLLEDYLATQSEGSGFGGVIASALAGRQAKSTLCTAQVKNC